MKPTISSATPADIPDLVAMIDRLCAFHGDTSQMGLSRAQSELVHSPQLHTLVARCDKTAVGYAVLESQWRPMNVTNALDIAHLFVTERWRGHGIGRALIAAAITHARGENACRLTIGTSPDNPAAAAAYRRMGLTEQTGPSGARFHIPLGPAPVG